MLGMPPCDRARLHLTHWQEQITIPIWLYLNARQIAQYVLMLGACLLNEKGSSSTLQIIDKQVRLYVHPQPGAEVCDDFHKPWSS